MWPVTVAKPALKLQFGENEAKQCASKYTM